MSNPFLEINKKSLVDFMKNHLHPTKSDTRSTLFKKLADYLVTPHEGMKGSTRQLVQQNVFAKDLQRRYAKDYTAQTLSGISQRALVNSSSKCNDKEDFVGALQSDIYKNFSNADTTNAENILINRHLIRDNHAPVDLTGFTIPNTNNDEFTIESFLKYFTILACIHVLAMNGSHKTQAEANKNVHFVRLVFYSVCYLYTHDMKYTVSSAEREKKYAASLKQSYSAVAYTVINDHKCLG